MKLKQNFRTRKTQVVALVIALVLIPAVMTSPAEAQYGKAAWQLDIDWASRDTGAPDCPWLYAPVPDCLAQGLFGGGNRACVMGHARQLAFAGQDIPAFGLVLITQCHNGPEQQNLMAAGPFAVANYLRNPY